MRFIGILNAAVWFGALIFFTFAVGPAFFSDEVVRMLGRPYAGAVAQVVVERYFILQQWCAGIAIAHLIVDWLASGRPFQRWALILLAVLFTSGLVGARVLQPRMKDLHLRMYAQQTSAAEKERAGRSLRILHGTSSAANLLVMLGVLGYLWHVATPTYQARFASVNRFKS